MSRKSSHKFPGRPRLAGSRWPGLVLAAAAATLAIAVSPGAQAAEVAMAGTGTLRQPLVALLADWSHETGHRVSMSFVSAAEARMRLETGVGIDLLVLTREEIGDLERQGLLVPESKRDLATSPASAASGGFTVYTAAVSKAARVAGVAGMLLDHLSSPEARKTFRERGFGSP